MAAATFEMTVPPVPPGTPASVRWPTTFKAEYDQTAKAYRMAFGMR
jgi:hypothetical protein